MIRGEMMERMSASEFLYWIAFRQMQVQDKAPKQDQTPEQMVAMLDMIGARSANR